MRLASVADLERFRAEATAARPPKNREIILSADSTCCILRGSLGVADALKKEIAAHDLGEAVGLRLAGCLGFCEIEPMVVILPQRILYQRVKPEDVTEIIERTILRGELIERLLYTDPATKQPVAAMTRSRSTRSRRAWCSGRTSRSSRPVSRTTSPWAAIPRSRKCSPR